MTTPDSAAVSQEELWGIIMRLADPSDLLRTILNNAAERPHHSGPVDLCVARDSMLVLTSCTVTIHQHAAPAGPQPAIAH